MTSKEILKVIKETQNQWVGPQEAAKAANLDLSNTYAQWETAYQLALLNEKVDKE